MKIKTVLLLLTFSIVLTLRLSTALAQYEPYMQIGLPEGAKVRFGTGSLLSSRDGIAYSPNVKDSRLALAGRIGIWIYNAETLQPIDLLPGPMSSVSGMSFSSDGSTLAAGLIDGTVDLWNVATSTRRKTLTPHPTVAYQDESGRWRHIRSRIEREVTSVSFGPDSILAVGVDNGTIELWNTATGELHKIFAEHHDTVNRDYMKVSFSPDGTTLASAKGGYTQVHLWDVATGELREILGKYGSWGAMNASFSPDGSTLATYNTDTTNTYTTVHLWNVATGELLKTFERQPGVITGNISHPNVSFSPDGSTLATLRYNTTYWGNEAHLWDVATGTLRNTLKMPHVRAYGVSFNLNGDTLAVPADGSVLLWDIATAELRETLRGHSLHPISLISPDGNTLAIGNLLWDISTGTPLSTLEDAGYLQSMSFSPDGSTLATGSGDPPYFSSSKVFPDWVHLWDVSTGTLRNILKGHTAPVMSVSFSPDGSTIASGSVYFPPPPPIIPLDATFIPNIPNFNLEEEKKGELLLWDVATGQQKNNFTKHVGNVYSTDFNFDGSRLAVASDNTVYLWDTATGELSKTFQHVDNVYSISFSPDGNTIATGSGDTVHLWDVTTGKILTTFDTISNEHTLDTRIVKFSPDGRTLAASIYSSVHLWDVATGTLNSALKGHVDYVYSLNFSPDGSTIASGSRDGTVLLWEVETERVMPQLTEDINGDGTVDILDLLLTASQFGQTGENKADVNGDGVVNIQDLVLVAAAFGEASAAPTMYDYASERLTPETVQQWLAAAKQLARSDATSQRGIVILEGLLAALTPEETALLPNYPNPFNPETWVPYQLAKRMDVSVLIYAADGKLVRTLKLGQQAAGVYASRNRAAYWDGKNEAGESVASGVYFYTLKAGDFTATRKMVIRK